MKGYVHSQESFGTVDGPGIRYVVFLQGCPMRCLYCHNPDTWSLNTGNQLETDEILAAYEKNRPYYRNGGLTVTGGEPLMQIDFVTELFEKAKALDIHTCLDTSGITYRPDNQDYIRRLDRLMKATDLVLLDIKHIDPAEHQKLTGQPNEGILAFARYLSDKKIPVWIRHVAVPGITDKPEYLYRLGYFIGELTNIRALDVLPYHTLGLPKYKNLGIDYPLKDTPAMDKSRALSLRAEVIRGLRKKREELGYYNRS